MIYSRDISRHIACN